MPDHVDLALRIEARRIGRAVRASGTQLRRVQEHAWLVAFVGMAGEHATIYAAHIGPLDGPWTFHFCPDPRDRDIHAQLLCEIADRLEGYLDWCAGCDETPQLFVTSPAAIGKLDSLADRLPYTPVDSTATKAIQDRQRRLRRFGGQLVYLTRREPHAGQQVLLTATALLSEHFVTGQDDQEDIHLGAQLAWVDPPAGIDPATAAEIAERTPMGANTDPEFDADVLIHDVVAYNNARRNGAPSARVHALAEVVGRRLKPVTLAMADGIEQAVGLLTGLGLPELPGLDEFVERDREAFHSHRSYVAGGGGIPLADRPKGAAFEYLNREDAEQQWAALLLHEDPVHRALARLRGHVIAGTVTATGSRREGTRTVHTVTMLSTQTLLRVRRGDGLSYMDDPRLRFVVIATQRTPAGVVIETEVTAGMRAVGIPAVGDMLDLADGAPEFGRVVSQRVQLAKRLQVLPATHADRPLPAVPRLAPTRSDPIVAVEGLR